MSLFSDSKPPDILRYIRFVQEDNCQCTFCCRARQLEEAVKTATEAERVDWAAVRAMKAKREGALVRALAEHKGGRQGANG